MAMRHELPGGQNESSRHTTVGNRDHSENHPASMDSSTDPGCLASERELRDSGFLTDPDQPGTTVTAGYIRIGRRH
jgi:hypothetical protein